MFKKALLLITILLCGMSGGFAQNCPQCDIALTQGARDEFETRMNYSYSEAQHELFSHDYDFWSTYAASSNKTLALDAAYSIYSAAFAGGNSSSQQSQKFENFRKNYESDKTLSKEEQEYLSTKTVSKTAYEAWTKCIELCSTSGIQLVVEGKGEEEFIVALKWIPSNGMTTPVKVTSIQFTNADFLRGDLKEQATIAPFNTLLGTFIRRNREKDVVITVSVENFGSKTVTIPKNSQPEKAPSILLPAAVPTGTVVAYAGTRVPPGWLLCDGSARNQRDYPALFNALGTSWGVGDATAGSFNLPDMRGMFLRGVDGMAANDPDHDQRVSKNGGNAGNRVGSYQTDEFKSHTHKYDDSYSGPQSGYGDNGRPGRNPGQDTGAAGGNETRPKNVYVFYIIKE